MPSLHAAYATVLAIYGMKLFKSKWRYLVLLYPFFIYVGTVYEGEHYAIDEIAGIIYAVLAYLATPFVVGKSISLYTHVLSRFRRTKKTTA